MSRLPAPKLKGEGLGAIGLGSGPWKVMAVLGVGRVIVFALASGLWLLTWASHCEAPVAHTMVCLRRTVWYELQARDWPFKHQPAEALIWQIGSGEGVRRVLASVSLGKEVGVSRGKEGQAWAGHMT